MKLEQPDEAPSGAGAVEQKKQLYAAAVEQAGQQQGFPLQQQAPAPFVPQAGHDVAAAHAAKELEKQKIEAKVARRERRDAVRQEREQMLLQLHEQQQALERQRRLIQEQMAEEDAKVERGHERKRRRQMEEASLRMVPEHAQPSSRAAAKQPQVLSQEATRPTVPEQAQTQVEQQQPVHFGKQSAPAEAHAATPQEQATPPAQKEDLQKQGPGLQAVGQDAQRQDLQNAAVAQSTPKHQPTRAPGFQQQPGRTELNAPAGDLENMGKDGGQQQQQQQQQEQQQMPPQCGYYAAGFLPQGSSLFWQQPLNPGLVERSGGTPSSSCPTTPRAAEVPPAVPQRTAEQSTVQPQQQ